MDKKFLVEHRGDPKNQAGSDRFAEMFFTLLNSISIGDLFGGTLVLIGLFLKSDLESEGWTGSPSDAFRTGAIFAAAAIGYVIIFQFAPLVLGKLPTEKYLGIRRLLEKLTKEKLGTFLVMLGFLLLWFKEILPESIRIFNQTDPAQNAGFIISDGVHTIILFAFIVLYSVFWFASLLLAIFMLHKVRLLRSECATHERE